jgi:hypothetical protein
MYVEMIDGLAAVRAVVDDQTIAAVEALFTRNLGRRIKKMAEKIAVAFCGLADGRDVFTRHYENMRGSLGADVGKGVDPIVLIDGGGGNLASDDFAE